MTYFVQGVLAATTASPEAKAAVAILLVVAAVQALLAMWMALREVNALGSASSSWVAQEARRCAEEARRHSSEARRCSEEAQRLVAEARRHIDEARGA